MPTRASGGSFRTARSALPRVAGRGTYDGGNKPYVDFNAVVAGTDKTRQFIHDDRAVANIILGKGIPPPPMNGYVDLAHSFEARESGTGGR